MQKGKLTPAYTKKVATALWEQITATLNATPGGAIKTPTQWNKTWRDLRKNVKNKASKEKQYRNGTGGGPPMPPPPPELDKTTDEKFLEILTPIAVEGNEVPDSFFLNVDVILHIIEEKENESNIEIIDENSMEPVAATLTPKKKEKNYPAHCRKHCIKKFKKKSVNSSRLSHSLRNNEKFLMISQQGMSATEKYQKKKLQLLEERFKIKQEYYEKKIKVIENISENVEMIANKIVHIF
ncbi:uncharacterized protein LOC115890285 [Sitophilus oryzae]|uniref:Regulatory protein zeste n=1 Tax=Sitophilus oryzae TaxID=7048 RepID=A0A6J2YQK3_SITOR|nr:uncharacterized protein LOC115890285 [Sitophilus oryzae]